MQRKPGFPVANCSIKMPDCTAMPDSSIPFEDDSEQQQRRQQLINFGHTQWGFNNWSWSVSKQELDFVDFTNGKYCAGVVAFVSITVKSFDIHRENIGYATSVANSKGFAIYKSRKCAVTNALRETLLSFGGSVASDLIEILETLPANAPERLAENNPNLANKPEPAAPVPPAPRKEPEAVSVAGPPARKEPVPGAAQAGSPGVALVPPPAVKNAAPRPLGAPTLPPANRMSGGPARHPAPPAPPAPPPPHARPNSNVSFVLQPVVGGGLFPPRLPAPPPPLFPNAYYEYPAGGWHIAYEAYDRPNNVNVNFNLPPKNLVVNGRGTCRPPDDMTYAPPPPAQGCWIKPTIFYDGFWTEQKVKKWVAEQVEKQFPEDASGASTSPATDKP